MLLAIDLGNSTTIFGVFDHKELIFHSEVATQRRQTQDELGVLLSSLLTNTGITFGKIDAAIISCVVPSLLPMVKHMVASYFGIEPLIVGPGIRTGLNIRFSNPLEVGADRIANSVAAFELYGGPLVVIDFGTATTFGLLDAAGSYLGGVVAPGINTSVEALFQRAAKLPWVELEMPKSVIGKNTHSSVQSGIVFGFAGLVEGILSRIQREWQQDFTVVATGNLAGLMKKVCERIDLIDTLLTLKGLRIVYERNAK